MFLQVFLLLTAGLSLSFAIQVDLLMLFALTREETDPSTGNPIRIIEPGNTAAFISTLALMNQLNNNVPPIPGNQYTCNDVVFTYKLADTQADFSNTLSQFITEDADLTNFDVILGPSRSTTCIPVSFASSPFQLPIISPTCTTPELDDQNSHPRIARTIPSDDFTAGALVKLIKSLPTEGRSPNIDNSEPELAKYTQVVVLYQEDSYGSKYKDSLFETIVAEDEDIEFLFFPFKPEDTVSIEAAVIAAAQTKINVFIGIFNLESLKFVGSKALELGILGPNRVWIFSDGILGSKEIVADFEAVDASRDILQALNNNFMIQSTGRSTANKEQTDIFDSNFLDVSSGYDRNQIIETLELAINAELEEDLDDFLDDIEDDPSDFALFAYDALLTVREYIDFRQRNSGNCSEEVDFTSLVDVLKSPRQSFSFPGVTGTVEYETEGSRKTETAAAVLFQLTFPSNSGLNEKAAQFEDGETWQYARALTFSGGKAQAPLLVDPPSNIVFLDMDSSIQQAMYVTAAVILAIVVGLFGFVYRFRNKNVIKAAQPLFLSIMLIGIVTSTLSVFFTREDNGGASAVGERTIECSAPFFLISLGITVTFSGLVFKLQRVATVANTTPELRDNKAYSVWDSIRLMFFVIAVDVALMITAYSVNPLIVKETVTEEDEFGQAVELYYLCEPDGEGNGAIYGLLIGFHILFYLYAFRLVFKTKDMSTDFQEGKWIAFSVIAQFQLFALGVPVVIAVGTETAGIRYLVISLIVHFSNVILLTLIFVPKVYRVVIGDDDVVWSDRNDPNSGFQHYSSLNKGADSRHYQDVRKSLYNTMATQDFGHEPTL